MASILGTEMADAKVLIGAMRVVVVARDAVRNKNVREDIVAVQWRLM
jgi:hypothetical protein